MTRHDDPLAHTGPAKERLSDAQELAQDHPAPSLPGPVWLPLATAIAVLLSGLNALVQVLRLLMAALVPHG